MLRNDQIKTIESITVLLTIIKLYSLEDTDFYKKTHLTTKTIDDCIKQLSNIIAETRIQKKKASDSANNYNKAHPDKHRAHSLASKRRHPEKEKQRQREYYKRNKEKRINKGGE